MITTDEFIKRSNEIHNGKYDYSKVKYNGTHNKVNIICPIHGDFFQSPHDHLKGCGCRKCANMYLSTSRSLTTEEFIEKARKLYFYILSLN